jgi:hypothetical protein
MQRFARVKQSSMTEIVQIMIVSTSQTTGYSLFETSYNRPGGKSGKLAFIAGDSILQHVHG